VVEVRAPASLESSDGAGDAAHPNASRRLGHLWPMDTEPEAPDLWAVPRIVVTTQFVAGGVFLLMALVNLLGAHPSGWQRFLGIVAAVVAGMAFGVAGTLRSAGQMVRRHMAAWHPESPVAQSRRQRVYRTAGESR